MGEISRRQVLIGLGLLASAGVSMPGCCLIRGILGNPCNPLDTWKKNNKSWWKSRQAWRERERQAAIDRGERADIALPEPYLECGRIASSRGWLGPQLKAMTFNQMSEVAFVVENKGNAPSWSCFVEVYEGPFAVYGLKFSEMQLNGRKIITLQPGEQKEVVLPFKPTREKNGSISIRCHDPIQDPGIISFQQYDRKNSGGSWRLWLGG